MFHHPSKFLCYAILLAATASLVCSCNSGLPSGFDRLPLDRQVKEYELHLEKYGRPNSHAITAIAQHGFGAANLACDRLAMDDQSLPASEALQIIHSVQTGGCSLKKTRCESVVRSFVAGHPIDSSDGHFARITLEAIENNYISPTEHIAACDNARSRKAPASAAGTTAVVTDRIFPAPQ
jgi:hypothetical protein